MGSPLQKIFQGRGDKEGASFRFLRLLPPLFLAGLWAGQLLDLQIARPDIWFFFCFLTVFICSLFIWFSGKKEFMLEFLFSLSLLYAGVFSFLKLPWMKLAYFPFLVGITAWQGLSIVIPLSLLIPLIQPKVFLSGDNIVWEAAFAFSLVFTTVISSLFFSKMRGEKYKAISELSNIRDKAKNSRAETEMDSFEDDEMLSHFYASVLKTDEEIKETLLTIKHAVYADSVNLFVMDGNSWSLRCSTEEKENIIITGKGAITSSMQERKPFYSGEVQEKEIDPGYIKNVRIASLFVIPIIDETAPVGLLSLDSSRYQAFNEPDRNTVQMFSKQLVRILERERVYFIIKRDISSLRLLKDQSSNLVSSLNMDVISRKLCEAAAKIGSGQVFFFRGDGKDFELKCHNGEYAGSEKRFDFSDTIVNLAIENRQNQYISDTRGYTIKALPFKAGDVRSAIAIPLLYESEFLGILVMCSGNRDFLDAFQRRLLEVLCNQASISMANAIMHAEIEELATTDGLTGLYNHRSFQEKLTEELKRLSRQSGPVSLVLSDIDYFKKINDSYGHPAGDLVLKGVADAIRKGIRDIDIPARYGGEEFAVILPGTDGQGAQNIAERLRKAVMASSCTADGKKIKVTISIGIATIPGDALSKEELIEKADQALYYAKHNGRNQSINWSLIKQ